jgi:predicted PP-loop superfamily ATPase
MRVLFAGALALSLCGCSLSAGAAHVVVVDELAIVKPCRSLGLVSAPPPFLLPDDWRIKLRNQAAALGGDTVYAKTPGLLTVGSIDGEAFVCGLRPTPR